MGCYSATVRPAIQMANKFCFSFTVYMYVNELDSWGAQASKSHSDGGAQAVLPLLLTTEMPCTDGEALQTAPSR